MIYACRTSVFLYAPNFRHETDNCVVTPSTIDKVLTISVPDFFLPLTLREPLLFCDLFPAMSSANDDDDPLMITLSIVC